MFPKFVDSTFENKILNLSHEEYHARKDCVHSSSLKNMVKSPHAFKYFSENPLTETPSMKFGTLAHGVMLEGSLFLSRYVVQPVFKGLTQDGKETTSMNAKAVKEQHKEWLTSLPENAMIMTQEEHDKMMFMLDSLLNHKFVMEVLKDGEPEFKKQWRDHVTGLACISSDDFVSIKNDVWVDIKTTPSSKWTDFRRSVEYYNYPFQAAFYDRGLKQVLGKAPEFKVWIAVESKPPYECRVFTVSPYYLEAGETQVRKAMSDLSNAIKNNHWPQGQMAFDEGEPSGFYKSEFDPILLSEGI